MRKTICELFAGVGGFRLGFEKLNSGWETVWFNQWEPDKKRQWAHQCYCAHFGDLPDMRGRFNTNVDIALVNKTDIPDHLLLVGGFPCQDYSVAQPSSSRGGVGIEGKKGVLWWEIYETIKVKRPFFCLFENVDRLLKSPAKQRGRDFGIMLSCFHALGYSVEWRVVNSASYGSPQRRKRVFLFAARNDVRLGVFWEENSPEEILMRTGFFPQTFPVQVTEKVQITSHENTKPEDSYGKPEQLTRFSAQEGIVESDLFVATERFSFHFENSGYMNSEGSFYTMHVNDFPSSEGKVLRDVLDVNVEDKYYLPPHQFERWQYLKGSKKVPRVHKNGHEYFYSEGKMAFPDALDKPSRTLLTSEASVNRSSHVVADPQVGRLRTLTPVEVERLQGFNDGWTETGMPERARYFMMGNAVVVPMVTKIGKTLDRVLTETVGELRKQI